MVLLGHRCRLLRWLLLGLLHLMEHGLLLLLNDLRDVDVTSSGGDLRLRLLFFVWWRHPDPIGDHLVSSNLHRPHRLLGLLLCLHLCLIEMIVDGHMDPR